MTEVKRSCDGCTACCEGWLSGVVNGREFYPGTPCHYVGCSGCSIYDSRPVDPCIAYSCEWVRNTDLPEWMKPSKAGVIVTGKGWQHPDGSSQVYLEVVETGKKIDATVLNWLFKLHLRSGISMKIQISGGFNWYGSKEFFEGTRN